MMQVGNSVFYTRLGRRGKLFLHIVGLAPLRAIVTPFSYYQSILILDDRDSKIAKHAN